MNEDTQSSTHHNQVQACADTDNYYGWHSRVSVWFTETLIVAVEALLERSHTKIQLQDGNQQENYTRKTPTNTTKCNTNNIGKLLHPFNLGEI